MPGCEPIVPNRSSDEAREVGGYHLLRSVGDGGMSRVFLSFDVGSGSPVAVKVLADHLAHSREFVGRFYREARLCRLLAHPNLVRGLAAGYDAQAAKHYLVLEYIDGPTAHTALTRVGRFPLGVAVQVGIDIAGALAFLHSRQYVHRDVKPDNILLHPAGIAKLADLGLAKRLNDDPHITSSTHGVGTSYYMAYEQALNANLVDGRSDVFALGATLYHLLTGEVPFPGTSHEEVIRVKEFSAFRPVREANRAIPAELAQIVSTALARDPRARFQTAEELAQALEATKLATPIPVFGQSDGGTQTYALEAPTRADLIVANRSDMTGLVPPVAFSAGPGKWTTPLARGVHAGTNLRSRLSIAMLTATALSGLAAGAILGARSAFAPTQQPDAPISAQEIPGAGPTSGGHPPSLPQ
jgi:serine/threonine protein kinase